MLNEIDILLSAPFGLLCLSQQLFDIRSHHLFIHFKTMRIEALASIL